MLGFLSTLFSGGSVVKSVENVAKEWIQTDTEKAEAKSLMVKTLDPNGLMRREISAKISGLYIVYILVVMTLTVCQSFSIGDVAGTEKAINSLKELFIPITAMFSAIVGASFGVNSFNIKKGK